MRVAAISGALYAKPCGKDRFRIAWDLSDGISSDQQTRYSRRLLRLVINRLDGDLDSLLLFEIKAQRVAGTHVDAEDFSGVIDEHHTCGESGRASTGKR